MRICKYSVDGKCTNNAVACEKCYGTADETKCCAPFQRSIILFDEKWSIEMKEGINMNKAICWKKKNDEHFTGSGTEYQCGKAYAKFESAVVDIIGDKGEVVTVDINDPDFVFIFRNGYDENVNR